MSIKVKGETYENADELRAAINELRGTLEDMPQTGPHHANLAAHIKDLEDALGALTPNAEQEGEAGMVPTDIPPVSDSPPATNDESEETEQDTDDEEEYPVCPMCGGHGTLAVEPPVDTTRERCHACDGHGKVYTGSRVIGHAILECSVCQGQGWTTKNIYSTEVTTTVGQPPAQAPGAVWDTATNSWLPPIGQNPPWNGATWDSFYGRWS